MICKASSASLAGVAHQQLEIPCQDSVHVCRENSILCAALSDGAGSRSMSHFGARQITQAVSQLICEQFHRLYAAEPAAAAQEILNHCLNALAQLPYPVHTLAGTLLFFAADGHGRFLSGHLGDGIMIAVEEDTARLFSAPENGEDPCVTWFVTSPDAPEHFRITAGRLPDHGEMLLMSDGMAAGLYHYPTATPARACVTISKWLREEAEDVISAAIAENMQTLFSKKSSDDLSMIVISW